MESYEVLLFRVTQHHQAADRHHHRAANSLQDAGRRELPQARAEAAEHGGKREYGDGETKYRSRAEAVGNPPAHGNEDRQRQHVSAHARAEGNGGGAERRRHLRQGSGNHCAVEILHEKGAGYEQGDENEIRASELRHRVIMPFFGVSEHNSTLNGYSRSVAGRSVPQDLPPPL